MLETADLERTEGTLLPEFGAASASEVDQLVEALTQAHDRQLRLYELGRLNVESFDRAATMERLFAMTMKLTDSTAVVLIESDGRDVHELNIGEIDVLRQVREHALSWHPGGPVKRTQSLRSSHSLLTAVAVGAETYTLGVGRESDDTFGTPDQKMVDAIGAAFGSALRLLALHEQAVSTAVVEREHSMAAAIVASSLANQLPTFAQLETAASTLSARVVGGDFYVAVATEFGLRFVVGDVAGKGLPAAVLMSNAVTVANLVLQRKSVDDPVMFLEKITEALDGMLTSSGRFVTMVVGTLTRECAESDDFVLRLANAGHSPICVVADAGRTNAYIHNVPPLTPPVGVMCMRPGLQPYTTMFGPRSVLLVGSDGLVEQECPQGEHFGAARLEQIATRTSSATQIHADILDSIRAHGSGTPPSDDQTVFVVSYPGARS